VTQALFRVRFFGAALLALLCAGCQLREPRPRLAFPNAVALPLSCSDENKLLIRATVPGGHARMLLDTGAPVSCADTSQGSLFHFAPLPESIPPSIVMNGQQHKTALVPQLEFGGVSLKNCPVVLTDLSNFNRPLRRHDCDAILGLNELRRLRAVVDFGSHTLWIPQDFARLQMPVGWCAVPMRVLEGHLVVPVAVRGVPTLFIVDTGAPISLIDSALRVSRCIPLKKQYTFSISAIHYQTKSVQLGMIPNLQIGSLNIGQTPVGVLDIANIMGSGVQAFGITGLIGSHTLEQWEALIDCDSMQLYLKQNGKR